MGKLPRPRVLALLPANMKQCEPPRAGQTETKTRSGPCRGSHDGGGARSVGRANEAAPVSGGRPDSPQWHFAIWRPGVVTDAKELAVAEAEERMAEDLEP